MLSNRSLGKQATLKVTVSREVLQAALDPPA